MDEYIKNIDCRLGILEVETNEVSLILTDPLYFIDGMDSDWDTKKLKSRVKDGVIGSLPVGMKFSVEQGRELQKFLTSVAKEWIRVIRPGGFCLVFSQNRLVHRTAISVENVGFEIRDVLLWRYEGQAKAFTQEHFIRKRDIPEEEKERLIQKLDGRKTPQLKPQGEMIVLAQAPREGTFVDNWDKWETGLINIRNPVVDPLHFPGTVIPVQKPRERYGHITAKPVDLLRHLIRIFSAPEALVLDPFADSGSTGVAAKLEGRSFIWEDLRRIHKEHLAHHGVKLPRGIDYRQSGKSIQLSVLHYYQGQFVNKNRTYAILTIECFVRRRTQKTQMFSWHTLTGYATKEQHA